ncbi:hypothetical protein [Stenotrophomonas maltophilia]|uniref:hypothetical protein n=1 Tax=Stenotrophomonas maltophilia TaxID=40324 RepID=UPI0021C6FE9E|nr:hypothetical protein [Stenotrophomonas maltophilia]MCU1068845.1 hypothetical protein [Stenotrophomonas maltophilia]MCU1075200.1 hypothetical protein [Stenotrophomonas maltophilia]MCU1140954.1 hypothetical protein [Stenotrophomonas maltophilia]
MKMGERATHHLHHYPAKLIPQIAHFFLATDYFCRSRGVVLDPFGGTGTVALETVLSGREAVYSDANPLASLITETKLTVMPGLDFAEIIAPIQRRYKKSRKRLSPDVVNIGKWFDVPVINSLTRLRDAIQAERCEQLRNFLLVSFSATLRKVSNADPRLSVPVLRKDQRLSARSVDVISEFSQQLAANVKRMNAFECMMESSISLRVAGIDARSLLVQNGGNINEGEVDLIITSPPYAGAQKYIRASSLNLGWLGIAGAGQLKPLENQSIGREHLKREDRSWAGVTMSPSAEMVLRRIERKNPVRAAICRTYLREMYEALVESSKCLRMGGFFILVIGNNQVCGEEFWSSKYLSEMLTGLGFEVELELVDEIKSRGLMTKRNRSAGLISREWVIVFRKVADVGSSKRVI